MKTKNIFYLTAALVLGGSLVFSSCKKKEKEDSDTDSAQDHSMAETQSNDVVNIGDEASSGSLSNYKLSQPGSVYSLCATITRDTMNTSDNDTLIVDFGTAGCTGLDGRTRSGRLTYIYTHGMHYRDSANVINVSSNNYVVDGNQVNINSKTITNMGHVTSGMLTWHVIADISIVKANGKTIHWTTDKNKVLLQGELPNHHIQWSNAKVAVYGSASGTSASGETYSVSVPQSTWLVRDFTCTSDRRYFVSGEMDLTPSGKQTRRINFGNGSCDNQATVTINGNVYNITLH